MGVEWDLSLSSIKVVMRDGELLEWFAHESKGIHRHRHRPKHRYTNTQIHQPIRSVTDENQKVHRIKKIQFINQATLTEFYFGQKRTTKNVENSKCCETRMKNVYTTVAEAISRLVRIG